MIAAGWESVKDGTHVHHEEWGPSWRRSRYGRATAIHSGPPMTAPGPTSRCSPRSRSGSSCACSTTTATRTGSTCARSTGSSGTATCPASAPASGTATGCTALRPVRRAAVQPGQAAARPVRQGDRRPASSWGQPVFSYYFGEPGPAQQRRLRAARAALGGGQPVLRLGPTTGRRGSPTTRRVIYEAHVRGLTKQHPAVPEEQRGTYAGPGAPGDHRAPAPAGRHRDRADAGAPVRHRQPPDRPGPAQLLGLQHHRLLRPAQRLRRQRQPRPAGAGVQDDGPGPARGGHRGDPRRGLQPHRRGQPPRADAVLPRHRQRRLLPARRRRPALLHGHHRHRQQPAHAAPARAPADHGLAALLGAGDARGRVPVRPGRRAGPAVPRGGPAVRVLRPGPAGPGGLPGQADRRAVGRRRRRLPGRQLPAAVDRVERQVPGHRPRLLARRARDAAASSRPGSPAPATCTSRTAGGRSPRSTSSPRTTASRCTTWSPTTTSTTRPTARTTGTAATTTGPGTAAPRARPTTRTSSRCGPGSSATS